jgi:hypothetical protein
MKKILICGMMLGLMTGVGFAQRGRAAGGVGPTAGMPSAPIGRTAPNAVTAVPRAPAPNAVSGPSNVKTVTPNATGADAAKTVAPNANSSDNAKTVAPNSNSADNAKTVAPNTGASTSVSPNTNSVPDRAMNPDAQGVSDHSRITPNQ